MAEKTNLTIFQAMQGVLVQLGLQINNGNIPKTNEDLAGYGRQKIEPI